MKKLTVCAVALMLIASVAMAGDKNSSISLSFDSEDSRTHVGPRHSAHDARVTITSRDGSVEMMLLNDVVAVQLTDRVLAKVTTKEDAGFLEELIVGSVQVALRKAVEYPIADIRTAEIRDGALVLINDRNQPVFREIKVNGTEVLKDFAIGDAARFVNAFRAVKSAQR
jgi:hypothetical protein